jgi:transcription elongation regulator 1
MIESESRRNFSALLADLVRNTDFKWKEIKKQLKKDHRWETAEILERDERERIFNDHIANLTKKKRDKFREMLDEVYDFNSNSSWKDIKKNLRDDPRYLKFGSDAASEEFQDYVRDKNMMVRILFYIKFIHILESYWCTVYFIYTFHQTRCLLFNQNLKYCV